MIHEHLLYSEMIEGNGKITKEPTFLGATLLTLGLGIMFYAVIVLCSAL